jgi:uncharacterized repeat protein (TIGR04138 family)
MQEIEGGTFDPEAQWQAKCEKLHAEHPEYSSEAYRFVQKSILQDYFKRDAEPPKGSRSFSALLESCQDYANEVYGASAKAQLKSWGIETYLDVGEILILNGSGGIKGEIDLVPCNF